MIKYVEREANRERTITIESEREKVNVHIYPMANGAVWTVVTQKNYPHRISVCVFPYMIFSHRLASKGKKTQSQNMILFNFILFASVKISFFFLFHHSNWTFDSFDTQVCVCFFFSFTRYSNWLPLKNNFTRNRFSLLICHCHCLKNQM